MTLRNEGWSAGQDFENRVNACARKRKRERASRDEGRGAAEVMEKQDLSRAARGDVVS